MKVNPPKPERESNRRRKKKSLDDDFIDLSDPSSMYLYDWNERKSQGNKKNVKKKPEPMKTNTNVEQELEQIMQNHKQSFSYENNKRRTVSPLRLSLNNRKLASESPDKVQNNVIEESDDRFDLTDRDSVRQLMVNKRQNEDAANLNNALDDAMADFGANEDLVIDESPKNKKKKPLKLRLSVGSLSEFNSENGSPFNNYGGQSSNSASGKA